jgi:uncharacterized protein YciI
VDVGATGRPCGPQWCSADAITQGWGLTGGEPGRARGSRFPRAIFAHGKASRGCAIPQAPVRRHASCGMAGRELACLVRVMRLAANVTQPDGMKIINYAKYIGSAEKVSKLRPAHREYMTQLLAEGRLVAGGPFTDGSGALFIYEAASLAAAEEIVAADPYCVGGAFASYTLSPWDIIKANPQLIPAAQ